MRLKFDKSKNFAIMFSKITREDDKKKTKEREKIEINLLTEGKTKQRRQKESRKRVLQSQKMIKEKYLEL